MTLVAKSSVGKCIETIRKGYKGTANFYEFEHSEMPIILNSIWTKLTSTKRKLIINQLISGKQYSFRVAGASSDPTRVWSDEIQSFVL